LELEEVFSDRFISFCKPHGSLPSGSVILVGSMSHLAKNGLNFYAPILVETMTRMAGKVGPGVSVIPFVLVLIGGIGTETLTQDMMDLDSWIVSTDAGQATGLPDTRDAPWQVILANGGGGRGRRVYTSSAPQQLSRLKPCLRERSSSTFADFSFFNNVELLQGLAILPWLQRGPATERRQLHGRYLRYGSRQRADPRRFQVHHRGDGHLGGGLRTQQDLKQRGHRAHTIRMQRWPSDLDLRKGLLSCNWKDISTIVSCRDASVYDDRGAGIPAEEFLRILEDPENGKEAAAVRWAVRLSCCWVSFSLLSFLSPPSALPCPSMS
jgi:hypothetical protein